MVRLFSLILLKFFAFSLILILLMLGSARLLKNNVLAYTATDEDFTDRVYLLDLNTGVRFSANYATGIIHASSHSPIWSPDGSRLAFFSTYDRYFIDVHEMSFVDADVQNFTSEWGFRMLPFYSTSVDRTAFMRLVGSVEQIFLQTGTGQTPELLLENIIGRPQLSPDGRYIAYLSQPQSNDENAEIDSGVEGNELVDLYVQDLDTGTVQNMTAETEIYGAPSWSPNGQQILLSSWDYALYLMDAEMSTIERISEAGNVLDFAPLWSPDGTSIAFLSRRNGNYDLYLYDLLSGSTKALTTHSSYDMEPTWSPDSAALIFVSGRSGREDLYRVDVASGVITRLTDTPEREGDPTWRPNS